MHIVQTHYEMKINHNIIQIIYITICLSMGILGRVLWIPEQNYFDMSSSTDFGNYHDV